MLLCTMLWKHEATEVTAPFILNHSWIFDNQLTEHTHTSMCQFHSVPVTLRKYLLWGLQWQNSIDTLPRMQFQTYATIKNNNKTINTLKHAPDFSLQVWKLSEKKVMEEYRHSLGYISPDLHKFKSYIRFSINLITLYPLTYLLYPELCLRFTITLTHHLSKWL